MTQHRSPLRRMFNPITGEIRLTTPKTARLLSSYGWRAATLAEYLAYQQTLANYTALKHTTKIVRH